MARARAAISRVQTRTAPRRRTIGTAPRGGATPRRGATPRGAAISKSTVPGNIGRRTPIRSSPVTAAVPGNIGRRTPIKSNPALGTGLIGKRLRPKPARRAPITADPALGKLVMRGGARSKSVASARPKPTAKSAAAAGTGFIGKPFKKKPVRRAPVVSGRRDTPMAYPPPRRSGSDK
jgi:hypothetical protein